MESTLLWFVCNLSCIITFIFHVMIAPFFPETALEKGVSHVVVGYIFSAYPVANLQKQLNYFIDICEIYKNMIIASSILLIRVFDKISKKNIIIASQLVTLFSEVLFIVGFYVQDTLTFTILSMSARILQGIACSGILSATYTVLLQAYPELTKEVSVTQEMSNGVGYMIGPVIGSLFFKYFGYVGPFYATGAIQLVLIPLQYYYSLFPMNSLENLSLFSLQFNFTYYVIPGPQNSHLDSQQQSNRKSRRKLDYSHLSRVSLQKSYFLDTFASRILSSQSLRKLLRIKRLLLATIANFISYLVFVQVEPVLAPQLLEVYQTSQNVVLLFFSIIACGYILGNAYVFFKKDLDTRSSIFWSFFVQFISLLLWGPSILFNFPNQIWTIAIGMLGIGMSCGVAYTCYFPEAIEAALEKYPEEQEAIGECITVLYTNSFALAEILAPILSTHFKSWFGYRQSADIFAVTCLIFFVVYYWFVMRDKNAQDQMKQNINISKDANKMTSDSNNDVQNNQNLKNDDDGEQGLLIDKARYNPKNYDSIDNDIKSQV